MMRARKATSFWWTPTASAAPGQGQRCVSTCPATTSPYPKAGVRGKLSPSNALCAGVTGVPVRRVLDLLVHQIVGDDGHVRDVLPRADVLRALDVT